MGIPSFPNSHLPPKLNWRHPSKPVAKLEEGPTGPSWGLLCLHTASSTEGSVTHPSGRRPCTLPEMAPSYNPGLSYLPPKERTSAGDTRSGHVLAWFIMELAGQMNFQEEPAGKQWDPRLFGFACSESNVESGVFWVGLGAALAMRTLGAGGVMLGLRHPSLSLAPPVTHPRLCRTDDRGEEFCKQRVEGLAMQPPWTPAREVRSLGWEWGCNASKKRGVHPFLSK